MSCAALLSYKRTGCPSLRDKAVEEQLPLVYIIAKKLRQRIPPHIDFNDLVSAGSLGLLEAIEGFDPGRNVKFSTYATFRIHGRMIDELRSQDWVPRLDRDRFRKAVKLMVEVEWETGRPADATEIADRLGLSVKDLANVMLKVTRATFLSLSDPVWFDARGQPMSRVDQTADTKARDPAQILLTDDLCSKMLGELSFRDGLILFLYYLEGLTMREIGGRLGLSESRICQLHGQSIKALRSILSKKAA